MVYLAWKRLIRFEAEDGRIHYGQPEDSMADVGELYHSWKPFSARILRGKGPLDPHAELSRDLHPVRRLLAPLDARTIRSIRALGTNYAPKPGHKRSPIPILFMKVQGHASSPDVSEGSQPLNTLAGPEDPILLPPAAAEAKVDYEVEIVVVIGQQCKDVSAEEAMDYVAALTICNDVSSRQRCADGGQWGLGKSFDSWLPLGPCLVNASLLDVHKLELKTEVNGRLCQQGNAVDMLFDISTTIAELSAGTTLEAGSIILMGSPPPLEKAEERRWLKHGDQCKLTIQPIGSLYNRVSQVTAAKARL